jgi:hypothetical protein
VLLVTVALLLAVPIGLLIGVAAREAVATLTMSYAAPSSIAVVTVPEGATVWELALRMRPGVDPGITVHQVLELNNLESVDAIAAGDRIRMPLGGGASGGDTP